MKYFEWNHEKNKQLKLERGLSFERIVIAITTGGLITVLNHPNNSKYPNQKMYVVKIENYVYLVPFVEDKEKKFLKTIIPSRKMTKKFITEKKT